MPALRTLGNLAAGENPLYTQVGARVSTVAPTPRRKLTVHFEEWDGRVPLAAGQRLVRGVGGTPGSSQNERRWDFCRESQRHPDTTLGDRRRASSNDPFIGRGDKIEIGELSERCLRRSLLGVWTMVSALLEKREGRAGSVDQPSFASRRSVLERLGGIWDRTWLKRFS